MRIRSTAAFLHQHNDFINYLDCERLLKTDLSAVVDLDEVLFANVIEACIHFAYPKGDPRRIRTVGVVTAQGCGVQNHDHDEESTVLYYIDGHQPLKIGNKSVSIQPGLMIFLDPYEKHEVEKELKDRYCVGVLMLP